MSEREEKPARIRPEGGYSRDCTLRDYFAGQALAGLLPEYDFEERDAKEIALRAYMLADAMLKASRT